MLASYVWTSLYRSGALFWWFRVLVFWLSISAFWLLAQPMQGRSFSRILLSFPLEKLISPSLVLSVCLFVCLFVCCFMQEHSLSRVCYWTVKMKLQMNPSITNTNWLKNHVSTFVLPCTVRWKLKWSSYWNLYMTLTVPEKNHSGKLNHMCSLTELSRAKSSTTLCCSSSRWFPRHWRWKLRTAWRWRRRTGCSWDGSCREECCFIFTWRTIWRLVFHWYRVLKCDIIILQTFPFEP